MNYLRPFGIVLVAIVFLGQGCLSTPKKPATLASPPAQPLKIVEANDGRMTTQEILGIRLPSEGVAAYKDTTAQKQDGVVYIGQSYRLALNATEYDRLVGRATILNVTDPFRDPIRTLTEPMWKMLGCVGSEKTYGLHCDLGKPTTSTVNGLSVQVFTVPFSRGTDKRAEAKGTSTVWLVELPANERAWLYVYPSDLQDTSARRPLSEWVERLTRS